MLRDTLLDTARRRLGDGQLAKLAAEVAAHQRDPYTLIEELAERPDR